MPVSTEPATVTDAASAGDARRSVVSDSASSATWTLASRATGLVRVLAVGAVFGPTYVGNLFHLANQLPWLVFEITVGSLLGSLLVPALMAHIGDDPGAPTDPARLARLAGGLTTVVVVSFGDPTLKHITLSLDVDVRSRSRDIVEDDPLTWLRVVDSCQLRIEFGGDVVLPIFLADRDADIGFGFLGLRK